MGFEQSNINVLHPITFKCWNTESPHLINKSISSSLDKLLVYNLWLQKRQTIYWDWVSLSYLGGQLTNSIQNSFVQKEEINYAVDRPSACVLAIVKWKFTFQKIPSWYYGKELGITTHWQRTSGFNSNKKHRLYSLKKTQRTVKTCTSIAQTVSVFYCVDLFTSYLKLSLMTIHYISNITQINLANQNNKQKWKRGQK